MALKLQKVWVFRTKPMMFKPSFANCRCFKVCKRNFLCACQRNLKIDNLNIWDTIRPKKKTYEIRNAFIDVFIKNKIQHILVTKRYMHDTHNLVFKLSIIQLPKYVDGFSTLIYTICKFSRLKLNKTLKADPFYEILKNKFTTPKKCS